jgi:hypothetical protein
MFSQILIALSFVLSFGPLLHGAAEYRFSVRHIFT